MMRAHVRRSAVAVVAATIVAVFFMTGVAQALMVELPLAKVARLSRTIVVGDVISVRARPSPSAAATGFGGIETVVKLRVTRVLGGMPGRTVAIRVPGGSIGGESLMVEDTPAFFVGEKCIVFLDREGGVVGWHQGVLPVVDGVVVRLQRSLAAVEKGIRRAAAGGDPAVLKPAKEAPGLRPAGSESAAVPPTVRPAPAAVPPPTRDPRAKTYFINDGFESTWTWSTAGSAGPTWGITSNRAKTGTYSAYCAQTKPPPPYTYNNSQTSWMILGPYNLSDATIAIFDFDMWFSMGNAGDALWYGFSTDGGNFQLQGWSGSTGGAWSHQQFDLREPFNGVTYSGQAAVWVAFRFLSDSATQGEGAYVDNVTLWKDTVAVPSITSITPTSGSAGTGTLVTITGTNFGASQGAGKVEFFYRSGYSKISAPITSWSDTSIVCTIPTGTVDGYKGSAASGPVTVTDNNGNWSRGYTYTVTFGYGGMKWASPAETYRVNANCGDLANEEALVDAATPTWYPWSAFTFTDGGTCTSTAYPPASSDGRNDIYWSSGVPAGGALAVNTVRYSGSNLLESDIVFNDNYTWCDGAVSGQYDVQTVALHETGHALNLRDLYGSGDSTEVMYGFGSTNSTKRSLATDDQSGILWIYGAAFSGTMGVNSGATYTTSTAVTLNSSVTATLMHFRDLGGAYGSWEAYGASKAWTLPAGDGVKTVEGQYQNAAGKYFPTSDTITLDQTKPSTSDNYDDLPHRPSVTVTFTPTDATSGVALTEYRIDGGDWQSGTSVLIRRRIRHKLSGLSWGAHLIEYRSTDNAGNVEDIKSCTVTLG